MNEDCAEVRSLRSTAVPFYMKARRPGTAWPCGPWYGIPFVYPTCTQSRVGSEAAVLTVYGSKWRVATSKAAVYSLLGLNGLLWTDGNFFWHD